MNGQYGGSGPGAGPTGGVGATGPSIWNDPQLLAIILGMGAQAVAGEHQQSWQARLGKGAMELGQSFKMAKAMESRRAENREFWERLFGTLAGGGEEDVMSMAPKRGGMPGMAPSIPQQRVNPMTQMLGG